MVIYLLNVKMGIVKAGISFFDPNGGNEVGMGLGRRGSQGLGGGRFPAIGLDDVAHVFVAQGFVM
jgi:hypothetical protein